MDEYTRGALTAVALSIRLHGSHTTAVDTLIGLGLAQADCSDLDTYYKSYLAKLECESRLSLRGLWVDMESGEDRVTPRPAAHKRRPA